MKKDNVKNEVPQRGKVKKSWFYTTGSIIILLFAAFTFVIIPAFSGAAERSKLPDYGSFNGKPVRFEENSDFFNVANEVISNYEAQGIDFNNQAYSGTFYTQAFSQAFSNVIGGYALSYFTESTGYKVPNGALTRGIKDLPAFKDASGEFSPAIYKALSDSEKRKAQEQVEKTLTQMRSYEDIFGSMQELGNAPLYGLKTSSAEIEFVRKMGEKLYSFEVAALNMKDYPDSEKVAFGKAHSDLFVKYNLKVISVETESKAKEVLKRINNSEITFEDAITEYSTKYYGDAETGMLSASYSYQLSNAVVNEADVEKITSLKNDQISGVIESPSGYCLFKSVGDAVQPNFDDEQTVAYVYSYLQTREKSVIEDYFVNIAKDFTSKATTSSFKEACDAFQAASTTVAPFALNYNNTVLVGRSGMADDSILRYAVSNENFYKTAFALKQNEISSPIILSGANQVIVVKCADITTGGTSQEDAKKLITPEIENASKNSINYAILSSPRIKDNSSAFMKAFLGNRY